MIGMRRRWCVVIAGVIAVSASPDAGVSQQSSETARLIRYQLESKSAAGAAALEYFVPFVGYAYAGDAGRGAWPGAIRLVGLAAVMYGMQDCYLPPPGETCSSTEDNIGGIGVLGYVAGSIWGAVGAYRTAQDHNTALLERLRLGTIRLPRGGGVEIGWSVSDG